MTEICHTGKALSEQFNDSFQDRLTAYYCLDHDFITRAGDLITPSQFSSVANAFLIKLAHNYYLMYKTAPSFRTLVELTTKSFKNKAIREELKPQIKEALVRINKEKLSDGPYMADQVATFAKSVAFDDAILKAAELKEKGDFQSAMAVMEKVQHIGANESITVYDYYASASERLKARDYEASGEHAPTGITTGNKLLDSLLYHKGWARREMVLFMGFAKSGKSTAMGEFSINATLAGYNVLYVSLEVHTTILSDRFDARLTETEINQLTERRNEVHRKLAEIGATDNKGNLWIIERPSGTLSPADLDRILDSMKVNGKVPDMVVVDYADLMRPSVDLRDYRANVKSIYTDLRAIYDKYNVAGMTASQTNREGGSSEVATMMHAADNIEKVRIADLIITINKTEEEERDGEARLYFAGSRNQRQGFSVRIKQNLDQMRFVQRVLDVQ